MIPAIANHILQSTIFAAVAGALALALRNNHARTRYCIWLTASLKFLVPFAVFVELGHRLSWSGVPVILQPRLTLAMGQFTQQFATPNFYVSTPVGAAIVPTPGPALILSVWASGCAAVLICWLIRWRRAAAILSASEPVTEGREIEALRRMDSKTGLVFSPSQMEPGIFGIMRPVLSLPGGIANHLDDDQLDAIFRHELCHVRRRDNLTAAIHMLVEAIFWFHPLVWWIGSRLVEERERACDEEVVRQGSDPEIYAESILKVCRLYLESPLPCTAGISGSDLARRIENIMKNPVLSSLSTGNKLAIGSMSLLALATPIAIGILNAQSPHLQFDAASVKQNVNGPREGATFETLPGGRLRAKYNPPLNFIINAYDVRDYQIIGAPAWMSSDFYDINAKADGATEKQMMQMLQSLLEDRFKLKFHRESRVLPIFTLTATKSGIKMQPAIEGSCVIYDPKNLPEQDSVKFCGNNIISRKGNGMEWNATKIDMSGAATALSNIMGRAVIDKTVFNGTFDVHLEWAGDEADLVTALQDQLGLQLKSAQGPVEVLVIDHVEKPSPN